MRLSFFTFLLVAFVLLLLPKNGFGQDATVIEPEKNLKTLPFEEFKALFPKLEFPFTISEEATPPSEHPKLPADSRIDPYYPDCDYRAIGQFSLAPGTVSLVYYAVCDPGWRTFKLLHFREDGEYLNFKIISYYSDFTSAWAEIGEDKMVMCYDKQGKKEVISHGYLFGDSHRIRKVKCSDGWCDLDD